MDPRIYDHAEILVNHCTSVKSGDKVVIRSSSSAEDLVVALYEKIGELGAVPVWMNSNTRAARAYIRACTPESIVFPEHVHSLLKEADIFIEIKGTTNTHGTTDVDPEKSIRNAKVRQPLLDTRMNKRWVGTQYPAAGNAQQAEMSTDAYADFVWEAINKDWDEQQEYQRPVVEVLESAGEIHIVSGETTDIRMSLDGMLVVNDYGEVNLPGGEVFTAPIPNSVKGEINFDKPLLVQGREIKDVYLRFKSGKVVEHSAAKNEEILTAILNTDSGSRRVGELGIGMNRDITQFTYNMLFDEKMRNTVHIALGRTYERTVPEDRERNESAVHQDMIIEMEEDSSITVDGEIIYSDGSFVFDYGFEPA